MLFCILLSILPVLSYTQYIAFSDEETISGQLTLFRCQVNPDNDDNSLIDFNVTGVFLTNPQNQTLTPTTEVSTNVFLFSIESTVYENHGVYTCHVNITDNQGVKSALNNTATLIVLVRSAILTNPQGKLVVVGSPFNISCLVEGVPTPNITWFRNGRDILDTTLVLNSVSLPLVSSILNFPSPLQNQSGDYSCQARNSHKHDDIDFNNVANSTPALIEIHPLPVVTRLEDRNVTINQSVSILCNATGLLPLNFTWTNLSDPTNDLPSNSQITIQYLDTMSILTIASISRQFTGYYQCTVSDIVGNASAQMYLLVQEEPSTPSQGPTSVLARSILISWSIGFDGNSPIMEFIIEMLQDGSYVHIASVSGEETKFNVTSLVPYSEYTFRVRASNLIGESEPTAPIIATTGQAEPDAAPRNFTLSEVTSDMISISWLPPLYEKWNGPITEFLIEYTLVLTTLEGSNIVNSIASGLSTPLMSSQVNSRFNTNINNLESYQNYTVHISACTVVGCGVRSEPIHTITLESAPSIAANITSIEPTSDSLRVTWGEIPLRDRNGVIQSYSLRYITPNDINICGVPNFNNTIRTGNDSRDFTIHGLCPYTTYRVYVAGETIALGPFGNGTLIPTEEALPTVPESFLVTYLSYTQVSFSWRPPVSPNGLITSYTLYYNQTLPSLNARFNTTSNLSFVVSDFTVGYTLYAAVTASNTAGESVRSTVLAVEPGIQPYIRNISNTTQTQYINVFNGDPLTLDCLIEGVPELKYVWMSDLIGSLEFLPETVPRYYVPAVIPEFGKYYVCNGSNLFGSAVIMFHVTVVELPVAFIQYSIPEFCSGGNGGLNCQQGESMYISCTYSQGLPEPYVNFTLEGVRIDDIMETVNGGVFYIDALSTNTSRLYSCEVMNMVGSHKLELFINLVGTFVIKYVDGVVEWELTNTGYVEGNYVIEFGNVNVTENFANISLSPLILDDIITIPGVYAWRLKFLNKFGEAAVSLNYPFVAGVFSQIRDQYTTLYGLIGATAFLCVSTTITCILIVMVCGCICRNRRKIRKIPPIQTPDVINNQATTSFSTDSPVEETSDVQPPFVNARQPKSVGKFRKTDEYNGNEAYKGPLAFHNRGVDSDSDEPVSKPKFTTFKPASNLNFKGRTPSPDEQVGAIGFRRRDTPDFPAPPSIENLSQDLIELREIANVSPPPPPVPEATYSKLF